MRKCIVAALIITFVISICIYTTTFTSEFCKQLENSVIECISEVEKENWAEVIFQHQLYLHIQKAHR